MIDKIDQSVHSAPSARLRYSLRQLEVFVAIARSGSARHAAGRVARSQSAASSALAELESAGRVSSIGQARAQRWLAAPLAGFTTNLLLPAALPLT